MKSLQTLECFDLVHSSLENIRGLGALTNLRHLVLSRDNQRDGRPISAEAMYTLFSSIQKLANLKYLNLTNHTGINDHVVNLLSPSRHMLRHRPGCMLPRVPRWSRDLCNLYSLSIAVDSMCKVDLHLIGELPSLAKFSVSIAAPAEEIIISHSAGFCNLKRFDFVCDVLSCLIFGEGAMPSLRTLSLTFAKAEWDSITSVGLKHLSRLQEIILNNSGMFFVDTHGPVGLKHLSRLQEIILKNSRMFFVDTHGGTDVKSKFLFAIRTHPNRPKIILPYLVLKSGVNDYLEGSDDE